MIRLERLRKEFGELVAVSDLDVVVPEGEINGLIGPNGAGKTTTIRMACGLNRADRRHGARGRRGRPPGARARAAVHRLPVRLLLRLRRAQGSRCSWCGTCLQWCTLTRMRQPVVKGIGWLALYYAAAATIAAVLGLGPGEPGRLLATVATPLAALSGDPVALAHVGALAVQAVACVLLLAAITRRLARSARGPQFAPAQEPAAR